MPFHDEGIISQFEGYEDLEELDWDDYRARYTTFSGLIGSCKAEGDDPDRYKLTKQADAIMLFFLFPEEELRGLFERLGYDYSPDTAAQNVEYYERRTSHGSTLSFIAHAGVLASDRSRELMGAFHGRAGERRRATSRGARPRRASTWA